jgi:hypothetical protein
MVFGLMPLQSGPRASLYLTLIGILAGFLSTFWNFSYTRTAMRMQRYLDAGPSSNIPKVKKQDVSSLQYLHTCCKGVHARLWATTGHCNPINDSAEAAQCINMVSAGSGIHWVAAMN